jgi:hypothetical protein
MKNENQIAALPQGAAVDPEVPAKPVRRTFTAAYKLRVLKELDSAPAGGIGLILRREGLYSSVVSDWRRARDGGALTALSKKRGRKPKERSPLDRRVRELEREVGRLEENLRKAEVIIDVQGKLAGLLGHLQKDERS